ncbi:hypothetical protein Tco_0312260 [Tanacetum coccineum]
MPSEGDERIVASKKETKKESSKMDNMWKLCTNGSSSFDGSGVGLMLNSPKGKEYTYALRKTGQRSFGGSPARKVNCQKEVADIIKEEGHVHAKNIIQEIHQGSCGMHAGSQSVVSKIMKLGYYWPSMHNDAKALIQISNGLSRSPTVILSRAWSEDWERLTKDGWMSYHSLVYGSEAVVPIEISMETKRIKEFKVRQNEKRCREDLDILEERRKIASIINLITITSLEGF